MGFKTDRMTAQDRILNQFDRVLKNEEWKERNSLKAQLEDLEKSKSIPKPKLPKEEKKVYLPIYALKYLIEEERAKKRS